MAKPAPASGWPTMLELAFQITRQKLLPDARVSPLRPNLQSAIDRISYRQTVSDLCNERDAGISPYHRHDGPQSSTQRSNGLFQEDKKCRATGDWHECAHDAPGLPGLRAGWNWAEGRNWALRA